MFLISVVAYLSPRLGLLVMYDITRAKFSKLVLQKTFSGNLQITRVNFETVCGSTPGSRTHIRI